MAQDTRTAVFIVDDNAMTRTLLRMMIQGEHYQVIGEAGTAELALERMKVIRPAIVCLDVRLPGVDGLELLRRIRALLPACAILMVTACNDRGTVETAMRDGANGFILKPFTPGTVLDALNHVATALDGAKLDGAKPLDQ